MRNYAFLKTLTIQQLARIYVRLYEKMSAGDGYQPYGYDWPTIRAAYPSFYSDLWAVVAAIADFTKREISDESYNS